MPPSSCPLPLHKRPPTNQPPAGRPAPPTCPTKPGCSYEGPLESLTTFYRPPARMMVSIDNMATNGVNLSQAGVEFNYAAQFFEGGRTQLRAAGLIAL